MEWQLMATAPRDGRVILGFWSASYAETIAFRDGKWVWSNDHDKWGRGSGPTHWAPFNPPKAEGA